MIIEKNELCHYGVLGMKWGKRHWQNKDGTLTEAGKLHYQHQKASRRTLETGALESKANSLEKKMHKYESKANNPRAAEKAAKYKQQLDKTIDNLKRSYILDDYIADKTSTMTQKEVRAYFRNFDNLIDRGIKDYELTGDRTRLRKYANKIASDASYYDGDDD